jgi:hypothetical protein
MYIEQIETEYGVPFKELQTECGIYWLCARALRDLSDTGKPDAELVAHENITIVWC